MIRDLFVEFGIKQKKVQVAMYLLVMEDCRGGTFVTRNPAPGMILSWSPRGCHLRDRGEVPEHHQDDHQQQGGQGWGQIPPETACSPDAFWAVALCSNLGGKNQNPEKIIKLIIFKHFGWIYLIALLVPSLQILCVKIRLEGSNLCKFEA